MQLIYHKQIGKLSNKNKHDEYTVVLDEKEYQIFLYPHALIIYNKDGDELRLDV